MVGSHSVVCDFAETAVPRGPLLPDFPKRQFRIWGIWEPEAGWSQTSVLVSLAPELFAGSIAAA